MALLIGLILGAAFVVFALQNTQNVMVTFLGWGFDGSVAIIVIAAMLAGIIISLLFSIPGFIRNMVSESRLRGHNETLRKELDDHKMKLEEAHKKIAEIKTKPDEIIVTKI